LYEDYFIRTASPWKSSIGYYFRELWYTSNVTYLERERERESAVWEEDWERENVTDIRSTSRTTCDAFCTANHSKAVCLSSPDNVCIKKFHNKNIARCINIGWCIYKNIHEHTFYRSSVWALCGWTRTKNQITYNHKSFVSDPQSHTHWSFGRIYLGNSWDETRMRAGRGLQEI